MKFKITRDEITSCLNFAKIAWEKSSQSKKDFGDKERKKNEFLADQTEGKLAEIVFKKFLETKGINITLDFNHYDGELNTDNGDFVVHFNNRTLEPKVDIKGSSSLAQWLLVENYKFLNRSTNEFVSNAFVMVGFGKDFPRNKEFRKSPEEILNTRIEGEVLGWANAKDFLVSDNNRDFWFVWSKGNSPWKSYILPEKKPSKRTDLEHFISVQTQKYKDRSLPTTISIPLRANLNYALPTKWLRKDWESLIDIITERNLPRVKVKKEIEMNYSFLSFDAFHSPVKKPKYSILIHTKSDYFTETRLNMLTNLLYSGIKVILLTDDLNILDNNLKDQIHKFKKSKLLQTYRPTIADLKNFIIVDGENNEPYFYQYANNFETFNYEQYRIEHISATQHLAVKAGAGTGKTAVMIQRVMCLLQRDGIKPSEIAMITFTRDSAKEMYSRLRNELFLKYEVTKNIYYLTFIEELKQMNISTIHSFAKKVLQDTGSYLGYGRDVQIRKFSFDRKRIIENSIEKFYHEQRISSADVAAKMNPFKLYEIIDIINVFWEELEKKGLTGIEVNSLDWGEFGIPENSVFFNELFKYVFPIIEEEFQIFKQENNAVSLNDLTRQVDVVLKNSEGLQSPLNKLSIDIKYLFIDEFQDSDDVQIRLISQIQQALKTKIFAVGDIKQSIYRFRGADHTAFKRLKEELHVNDEEIPDIPLQTNYRTAKVILDKLDILFKHWATQGWLTYTNEDELRGIRNLPKGLPSSPIFYKKVHLQIEDLEKEVVTMMEIALQKIDLDIESKQDDRIIAALVRTNREAKLLEHWAKLNRIETYLNIGGTFFISEAVKDFYHLIEALLYPTSSVSLINFLSTPYSSFNIKWTDVAEFNGNENEIYRFLESKILLNNLYTKDNSISAITSLKEWVLQIRIAPLFSVLRTIIKDTNVENRYFEITKKRLEAENDLKKEEVMSKAFLLKKQYTLNLNHLMDLFHQEFTSDFVTLTQIYDWLKRNKATNRDEDEPILNDIPKHIVNIITVHRSKGQEYHTVLLPFTDRKFRAGFNTILVDKTKEDIGWQLKKKQIGAYNNQKYIIFNNSYYDCLDKEEDNQVLQEETRLLYVALTRAKNQVFILKNTFEKYPTHEINTWGKLLGLPEGKV